jgi:hypothetical protein
MKKWMKVSLIVLVSAFALIGLVFTLVFLGMQFGTFNVKGSSAARNAFFFDMTGTSTTTSTPALPKQPCIDSRQTCPWNQTPEWEVVKGGLTKDAGVIARVSAATGVDGRMVAAVVIPEQIRFFVSEREVFKRYFEPLKILGSLSKFSLGVSGIKEETAKRIEQYANDPASPFYPGEGYAAPVAYPAGADHDAVLYSRLSDSKDHYYSYLYTALYLKEITEQWKRAGFDVAKNPEVLVTLFNIGFDASHPNASPKAAGAPITVGGMTYSFGVLGANFYKSSELLDSLPR